MRLVIVDSANCLYRAFFGIPPLRAPDGFPTHAIHGFVSMLRKVIREEQPDALVVVEDAPGRGFRHEIFADYKANRDAQPEDLSSQIPVAREVVDAYGIERLMAEGYEADDVIATLVERAPDATEIVIVSTDKDLMQLVSDRVVLLDTMKDRRIGPDEVAERFGVGPDHLLDVRALVGDPSDNIPGVKGIGEKGAAKLIQEWGDLETLLEHAGEIKAKRAREALLAHADAARLSKRLATLSRDAPVDAAPERFALGEPDTETLQALFARLGFSRLLDEIAGGAAPPSTGTVKTEIVASLPALEKLIGRLASRSPLVVCPVGSDAPGGLPPAPVGLAFALGDDAAAYLPLGHEAGDCLEAETVFDALRPLFEGGSARPWVARDTKRLRTLLAERGIQATAPVSDVELAAFLADPAGQHATAALASQHLGRSVATYEELIGRGAKAVSPATLEVEAVGAWAAAEVCALEALVPRLGEVLERDGLLPLYRDVEIPLTAVLSEMERDGVRVDEAALAALSEEFEAELANLEGRIHTAAGESFQISSPKQLQRILFEKLALPPVKRTKTGFSTDEGVLEQLADKHEIPGLVLDYRRLAKLKSTYVDALPPLVDPRTGRIHPSFHQTGAATGRLSCSHPNLQNIPIRTENGIRIREAFVPREGCRLLSADYSQVELRILAHYSGDERLIEAFHAGADIHRQTAADVAGVGLDDVDADARARAKAINFGIIYGLSAFGLAQQLGIAQTEAQTTIDAYFDRYRGVRAFLDATLETARAEGYVTTLLGRRRYLPDLGSRNRVQRSAAERMAVNTVIQGTAADLIKKAMVELGPDLQDGSMTSRMIIQVHDELVFEAPEAELDTLGARVRERMEGAHALQVPLRVEIGVGGNWREAH